ncbi:MAG: nucleotidyltransferase family protein [Nitrososphaerales archaeon]|nr:nucleotidyltransferase family protein [Nitrososphaerales archaeon]
MISGIILAAGTSKRMGSPKQDVLLAGRPILEYVVDAFLSSNLAEVVVVVRSGLTWRRSEGKLRVIVNPRYLEGLSESVKLGLGTIDARSQAALIGLGDKPLVLPSTVNRIVSAYEESGSKIVIPVHAGTRGNPILFDRKMFPEILRLHGDEGAKRVVELYEEDVLEVKVEDEGILVDVDTPADLKTAERTLASRAG